MSKSIAIAAVLVTTVAVWAASPSTTTLKPITYAHLDAEARHISGIQGGEFTRVKRYRQAPGMPEACC